jgi:hypothetical protein
MAGAKPRTSCRSLFKQLDILPLPLPYTFFNILHYQSGNFSNSSMHNINTRNKHHLHRANVNQVKSFRASNTLEELLKWNKFDATCVFSRSMTWTLLQVKGRLRNTSDGESKTK